MIGERAVIVDPGDKELLRLKFGDGSIVAIEEGFPGNGPEAFEMVRADGCLVVEQN